MKQAVRAVSEESSRQTSGLLVGQQATDNAQRLEIALRVLLILAKVTQAPGFVAWP